MNEIVAREARGEDIDAIREIFRSSYGDDYPYQYFYDTEWLKHSIYGGDMVMVVAEERKSGAILGTGSVVFDIGAHSDLIGEFGRLAVSPEARGRGVGKTIMEGRVRLIENRLHAGVVDNRTNHPYSQRISRDFGFAPVGFLPLKHRFQLRESIAMFARHFGPALRLRSNHPKVISEVAPIADIAMSNMGMEPDAIVDESTAAYPHDDDFELSEFEADGMPSLLRIERGRVREREVFGPMRLHYGFFKLATREANYIIARRPGAPRESISGALGFLHDQFEANIRIFELIAATDHSVRHLLKALLERARNADVEYIEIEVSAHAPRMQRTLAELGFLPAAYVPAMVFHEVERLDVIKMVRLLTEPLLGEIHLVDEVQPLFDAVMRGFETQAVLPQLESAISGLGMFRGLNREQARRLASAMSIDCFEPGHELFDGAGAADELFVLLDGEVAISLAGESLAHVSAGEVVGENAMLQGGDHTASARTTRETTVGVLHRSELEKLTRQRPDIGVVLYRNLAMSLGKKLRGADEALRQK